MPVALPANLDASSTEAIGFLASPGAIAFCPGMVALSGSTPTYPVCDL